MKKLICALFCTLCLLAAAPLYAQTNDLTAAMQAIDTYIETYRSGTPDDLLKLMTKDFQGQTKDEWAEIPGLFELKSLLLQKSEYEIVMLEKDTYDGRVEIEAAVALIMPDIEQIFSTIPESALNELETDAEVLGYMLKKLPELLTNTEKYDKTEEEIDILLVKENGQWKIDEER